MKTSRLSCESYPSACAEPTNALYSNYPGPVIYLDDDKAYLYYGLTPPRPRIDPQQVWCTVRFSADRNGVSSRGKRRAREAAAPDSDSDFSLDSTNLKSPAEIVKDAIGTAQNRPYLSLFFFTLTHGKIRTTTKEEVKKRHTQRSPYVESKLIQLANEDVSEPLKLLIAFCLCKTTAFAPKRILGVQRMSQGETKYVTDKVVTMLCPGLDAFVIDNEAADVRSPPSNGSNEPFTTRASLAPDESIPSSTPSHVNAFRGTSTKAPGSAAPFTPVSNTAGARSLVAENPSSPEMTRKRQHSELAAGEAQQREHGYVQPEDGEADVKKQK